MASFSFFVLQCEFFCEVIVQAVADTPTLNIGAELKLLAAEGSAAIPYPVVVRLNDTDGEYTILSVVVL